jgi:hypothetical protein
VENSFTIDLFKQRHNENNLFGEDTIVTDQTLMDDKEQEEYHQAQKTVWAETMARIEHLQSEQEVSIKFDCLRVTVLTILYFVGLNDLSY